MNTGEQDDGGSNLLRSVAGIVLAGLALGVAFNTLQLASGPRHGLAWIKSQVKLASLESIAADAEATPTAAAGAETTVAESSPLAANATVATRAARRDSTRAAKQAPAAATPSATATTSPHAPKRGAAKPPTTTAKPESHGTPAPATTTSTSGATPAATAMANLPAVPDTREPLEVQYATIKKFWDAGNALFVDARSAEEYAEAHIPGAVNLPFDNVFKNPELAKGLDAKGRPIVITYCGGGDCDLSRNLAFSLIDAGHKKVLVFLGGLPGWKEAGNAIVTGAKPGTAPSWTH